MSSRGAASVLLVVGLLQMAGDLLNLPALRGIGAATAVSPAPKVFSAVRGLETYSSQFEVGCYDADTRQPVVLNLITPARYARLEGPYNRRNVFGAVLAYGPVLVSDPRTRPLFDSVGCYALGRHGTLLDELDIHPGPSCRGVFVRVVPREGSDTGDLPLVLEPQCP